MLPQTKSILEELEGMTKQRDSKYVIESRADNLITSAVNLIDLINETYSETESDNLTRKLLNSIKYKDTGKFKRALTRVNRLRDK